MPIRLELTLKQKIAMKKCCIAFLAFLFSIHLANAQDEQEKAGVQRAMMDYIEGFYDGDSIKIIRSISPGVVKYGYWKNDKSGKYDGEAMSYQEMIQYSVNVKKKNHQQPATAIKKAEIFEIQDQTANGKVTAWWGTDYLLLEKINNQWMIRMILWQGPLKKSIVDSQ
jgi:Putative lumazine-binding